jgi:hypothetical protein
MFVILISPPALSTIMLLVILTGAESVVEEIDVPPNVISPVYAQYGGAGLYSVSPPCMVIPAVPVMVQSVVWISELHTAPDAIVTVNPPPT